MDIPDQSENRLYREWLANPMLRALLDVVREGVLIVDRDMHVLFANRTAREIFIFPAQQWPRLIDITRNKEIYHCFTSALTEKTVF